MFAFYRDLRNLPSFLGDVMAVEQIDPATYRWTIQGPLGIRAHWTTKVTEARSNDSFATKRPDREPRGKSTFPPGTEGSTEVREVMGASSGKWGVWRLPSSENSRLRK